MNPSATDDRTDAFARLLQELRDDPTGTSGEWLARLVAEIRPRGRDGVPAAREHFRSLIRVVQARPEFAAALNAHLGALLTSRMHRILYAESGILTNPGFMSGLVRRLLGRLLPPAVDTEYLRDLVAEVFDHAGDHLWLSAVPREDWAALLDAIGVDGADFAPARRKCRHEALEAMRLDSVRLAALGTDTALLQCLPALARHESPFLAQMAEVRGFIEHHAETSPSSPDDGHLEVLLCQCDEYVGTCVAVPARRASASTSFSCWRGSSRFSLGCASCSCRRRPARRTRRTVARSSSFFAWCGRRIAATASATCSAAPPNCSRGASRSRQAGRASTTSRSPAANSLPCTAPRPGPG
jgi:site-specific recombinase